MDAIDTRLRGSWVEIWEAAGEIVERKLFEEGKYKSAIWKPLLRK